MGVRSSRCPGSWRWSRGAAGGFGRATAQRLLREGARVALWEHPPARGGSRARARSGGQGALAIAVDARRTPPPSTAPRRRRGRRSVPRRARQQRLRGRRRAPVGGDHAEGWERHFRVNADGAFYCVRACLPDMREARDGKIVNIGSLEAQQGRPDDETSHPASTRPAGPGSRCGKLLAVSQPGGSDRRENGDQTRCRSKRDDIDDQFGNAQMK